MSHVKALWGTFSVADHLRERPLVSDVLLYDRLVVPVPAGDAEIARWEQRKRDPKLQAALYGSRRHAANPAASPPARTTATGPTLSPALALLCGLAVLAALSARPARRARGPRTARASRAASRSTRCRTLNGASQSPPAMLRSRETQERGPLARGLAI